MSVPCPFLLGVRITGNPTSLETDMECTPSGRFLPNVAPGATSPATDRPGCHIVLLDSRGTNAFSPSPLFPLISLFFFFFFFACTPRTIPSEMYRRISPRA